MSDATEIGSRGRPLRGKPKDKAQASWLRDLVYRIEYGAFRLVMALFWALGLERASALGGYVARTLGPILPVSRRAQRNLQMAMPELSASERNRIVRAMWDNLGRTFAEYPHLGRFFALKPGGRIQYDGFEHIEAAGRVGRGGFFVSGHFANWEVMAKFIREKGWSGAIAYRAPNNPSVDAWIARERSKHVIPVMAAKGPDGAKVILRVVRDKGFVAMLIDQKMNDGIAAPFFGRDAMTTSATAQLALKYDVPIVIMRNERLPNAHFKITVSPPFTFTPTDDRKADILALTTRLNAELEAQIRAKPEMWLWLHNRWPKA